MPFVQIASENRKSKFNFCEVFNSAHFNNSLKYKAQQPQGNSVSVFVGDYSVGF